MNDQNHNDGETRSAGVVPRVIVLSTDYSAQWPDTGTVNREAVENMKPSEAGDYLQVVGTQPALSQTVIPGSVSETDLVKVFDSFVEWVGWDDPTCIPASHKKLGKRQEILTERRNKLAKRLARVQGKLDQVEAALRPPEVRKVEAKAYLEAAVTQMGMFASMEVLTAALKKKFPKVIIRPRARKDVGPTPEPVPLPALDPSLCTTPAPTAEPPAAPAAKKATVASVAKEATAAGKSVLAKISRVQDVLDHEGMTMAEIKKLVPDFDHESIRTALDYLVTTGAVSTSGKKNDKTYKLFSQGS